MLIVKKDLIESAKYAQNKMVIKVEELRRNLQIKNFIMFLLGLMLMGLGISIYLFTEVGVGSWDVLHGNLTDLFDDRYTFGTWVTIVGFITISVSQLFYRNLLAYISVITGLILGMVIDLWSSIWINSGLSVQFGNPSIKWILFLIALIILGSGISLLVLSKLPPTPIDVLMISYMKRYNLNFNIAKFLTESTAFIAAVIVGLINDNPGRGIYYGTLLSVFAVGWIIQCASIVWRKVFKVSL